VGWGDINVLLISVIGSISVLGPIWVLGVIWVIVV
jgi:hypothetical protein